VIALSPGAATGCFNLLRMIRDHGLPLAQVCSQLPKFSSFRNEDLLEFSMRMQWVKAREDGIAALSTRGESLIEVPSVFLKLRRALTDYVEVEKPQWTALVLDGRARFMAFAPVEFRQTVSEAYLAEGYEDDVIAFWDLLAGIARGQRGATLSQIGRRGERLTLQYEKLRTGRDPAWRAIESNSDGYDVMSVVASDDPARMPIEVKASTQGMDGTAHLTRNEWDQTELMRHHTLHFWDLSVNTRPMLAAVARVEIAAHVPTDTGRGKWMEVEIPFAAFKDKFQPFATVRPPRQPVEESSFDWGPDSGDDPL
jgi:hypothetical protein